MHASSSKIREQIGKDQGYWRNVDPSTNRKQEWERSAWLVWINSILLFSWEEGFKYILHKPLPLSLFILNFCSMASIQRASSDRGSHANIFVNTVFFQGLPSTCASLLLRDQKHRMRDDSDSVTLILYLWFAYQPIEIYTSTYFIYTASPLKLSLINPCWFLNC